MTTHSRRAALLLCATVLASCDSVTPEILGDPVSIQWASCAGAADDPTWFAVQDGNGAWNRVDPTSGTTFDFTLRAGRGGIALHDSRGLFVLYGTSAELLSVAPACAGALRNVSGTITGYLAGDNVAITMGSASTSIPINAPAPASFVLTDVEAGNVDLAAVMFRSSFTGTSQQTIPDGVIIRRGIAASSTGLLDFNSEGKAPVHGTVIIGGVQSNESLNVSNTLKTPTTAAELSYFFTTFGSVTGNVAAPFYGLAGSGLVAGESQVLEVSTSRLTSATVTDNRYANLAYGDAADQTVTMGGYIGTVTVSKTAHPSSRYTIQSEYDKLWNFFVDQGNAAISVFMTRGYAGISSGQVDVSVPDLSGATGFDPAWLVTTGAAASWGFRAADADIGAALGSSTTRRAAQQQSTFIP